MKEFEKFMSKHCLSCFVKGENFCETCALNMSEVWRAAKENLIEKNKKLKEQLLLSEAQNYCKICGNTLDGYKPKEGRMNLYILVGNISTGKSTFVKHFLQRHPKVVCISRDALRYMIGGGEYIFNENLEWSIFDAELYIIESFMKSGLDVIIDEVSISKKMRAAYINLAKGYNYSTIALIIPKISKQLCVDRRMKDSDRGTPREVWEDVWDKFNNQFETPTIEEGFDKTLTIIQED